MSSNKAGKKINVKKRAQRATSNVFAMFDQTQVQEFKEAFYMIDQDKDGFITKEDLQDLYASLGKTEPDEQIEKMLNEATGPINFTMFLTMFGIKLNGTDSEEVIRNAFTCFDEKCTGFISDENLRHALTSMGDRFTQEEADELLNGLPCKNGNYNINELVHYIKNGEKESMELKKK